MFLALLGLAGVVRAGVIVNAGLDPDESQHLHAAWLVGQGRVPFVDFWEHHAPLFYYLLAPLTHWLVDSPAIYPAARSLMTLAAAATLLVLYRLARRVSEFVAMGAVLMLGLLPTFQKETTEVRPDAPALVAFMLALLALVKWGESARLAWLWRAGLALGVAGALTPKVAYALPGIVLAVTARAGLGRGGARRSVTSLVALAGGGGIPILVLLGGLALAGGRDALAGFFDQVVLANLRFADLMKTTPTSGGGAGTLALAVVGLGLTLWRQGPSLVRHPLHGPLVLPAVTMAALLLLPPTPAVYEHTWLPVLGAAAVYGSVALRSVWAAACARRRAGWTVALLAAVLAGVIVPAGGSVRQTLLERDRDELRIMRLQLSYACPGEPVLDGTALYVFRPSAYRYGALTRGVRLWVARGVIPEEEIERDIARSRAPVAYPDTRLRAMVGPVAALVRRYYVPGPEGLLLAGARIPLPGDGRPGGSEVDLLVSGLYLLTAPSGIEVSIDGRAVRRGWVELSSGRHAVAWTGQPTESPSTIGLVVPPCPVRRTLQARGSNPLTVPGGGD